MKRDWNGSKAFRIMRILACVLIILSMTGILNACGAKKEENAAYENDEPESKESDLVYTECKEELLPPLTLYADNTIFYADGEKSIVLNIKVPAEYSFNTIYILDEDANYVTKIEEDIPSKSEENFREYSVTTKLERNDTGAFSLTAYMAPDESGTGIALESNSLDIYCTGHVTLEMLETCMEVGFDLDEYLAENDLETLFEKERGDECLKEVLAWLEQDSRILEAEIVEDKVVYHTTDHVLGMYLPPSEEGVFGSGTDEESELSIHFKNSGKAAAAMENWDENGHLGENAEEGVYLDGVLSCTNNKFLTITPWNDLTFSSAFAKVGFHDEIDSGMGKISMAEEYSKELGYSVRNAGHKEGLDCIVNGELSDYGIIAMTSHGAKFKRTDGTYAALFCWPQMANEQYMSKCLKEIAEDAVSNGIVSDQDEFYSLFFHEGYFNADHTLMALQDGGIIIGSNYIMQRYQNKFFDNTIFYTGACKGASDKKFIDFCLSHGMKAYIGYKDNVGRKAEMERFYRIFSDLKEKQKNGHTKTLDESALIIVTSDNLRATRKYGNWRIVGLGDVSGKVAIAVTDVTISKDGSRQENTILSEPGGTASVSFHRFMNQRFENGRSIKTNTDGSFKINGLNWGVYGVTALLESSGQNDKVYSGMTLAAESFDAGVLELPRDTAEIKANVFAASSTGAEEPVSEFDVTLIPTGEKADEREECTVKGLNSAFEIKDLKAGEYIMQITSKEGVYTESVILDKGHNYNYEAILLEGDFWFKYIKENIVPKRGYASLDTTSKTIGQNWNYPSVWDRRTGVLGAQVADLNNDKIEDCVLYYFDNTYVYTPKGQIITNDPKTTLYAQLLTKNEKGEVVEKEKRQIFISDSISFCDGVGGILEVDGVKYVYFEVNTSGYYSNVGNTMYTFFTYDGEHFRPASAVGKTGGGSSELEYGVITYDENGQYTGENVTDSSQEWYCADGSYSKQLLCADGDWRGNKGDVLLNRFDPQEAMMTGLESVTGMAADTVKLKNGPYSSYYTYRNNDAFSEGIYYNCNGDSGSNGARSMQITIMDNTGLRVEK